MVSDSFLLEQIDRAGSANLLKYEYRPKILDVGTCEHLAIAMRRHMLVLAVGAGVSYPSGIPDWQTLIQSAAREAFGHTQIRDIVRIFRRSHLSPVGQVRLFENLLGAKAAFRIHLAKAVYARYLPGNPQSNLLEIARFVIGPGKPPRINTVITYNFDDLLEAALRHVIAQRNLRVQVRSVYSEELYNELPSPATISVYHPHGFLPSDATADKLANLPIVFSEPDYHSHFLNYAFWANTLQMSVFSTRHCLFAGLSFSDSNLRRLLDYSRGSGPSRHVAIRAVQADTTLANPRHIENYIVERDLASLGVRTLWVRSHNRIVYALGKISAL